jgi:DNA-directed RNA polymerase subunit RPC12/RpoP
MRFECPHCGVKLKVPDTHAGKGGRCPHCKGRIIVPQKPVSHTRVAPEKASAATGTRGSPFEEALFDLPPKSTQPAAQPGAADGSTPPDEVTSRSAWDFLLYPMNVSGIIHLLIFSLLPPLWAQAMKLQFWVSPGIGSLFWLVLLTLYLVHYLATCLSGSAQGETRAADINSASSPLSVDALLSTSQTVLPAVALTWIGPVAYFVIRERVDWILIPWVTIPGFVFPMVLLSVNDFDSLWGASPLLVLPSIVRVLGPYCGLVFAMYVLTGLAGGLMYLTGRPGGVWFARPPIIYVLLVQTHLLGRFYWRYQERLGWGA